MIERTGHRRMIESLLGVFNVVGLLGARQVGKTTLAGQIAGGWEGSTHYFDLERPADLSRLDDPELGLEHLEGLIVLDEIQRRPELFPYLRGFVDRHSDRRVLILGSASPELLRQSSETLAGRIGYHELTPMALGEIGIENATDLWVRGGFPRSLLAGSDGDSYLWREAFVRTYVERDLPLLGSRVPAVTNDRFWRMLASVHGQIWNASRFGAAFGVSDTTVRRYLDFFTSALVVRQLQPWHENVTKRQVKSPKIFISDSGVLHALLGLGDLTAIERHVVVGASWEGFVLSQITAALDVQPDQMFFWATHSGAELDLLIFREGQRVGIEIKRTTTPKVTRSLRSAIETLHLDRTYLVHAGQNSYPIAADAAAVALVDITNIEA